MPALLRAALRSLRKSPAYAAVVVLSLSTGIGACVLTFSALEAQWSSVPLPESDRLVRVSESTVEMCGNGCPEPFDRALLRQWQGAAFRSITALAPYTVESTDILRPELPDPVRSAAVGAGFFEALGVQALTGRLIGTSDCTGGAPVAAVSSGFARDVLGGVQRAVGSTLVTESGSHTVVGVLPRGFTYPSGTEVWFGCNSWSGSDSKTVTFYAIARLTPGVTDESARSEILAATHRLRETGVIAGGGVRPGTGRGVAVHTYSRVVGSDTGTGHLALIGAVWLAFVVACANVANLTLIRALRREREVAVRFSLGARPRQIAALLLTESGLLVVASTILGLFLASLALTPVSRLAVAQFGFDADLSLNAFVVGATVVLALVVTAAFGLAPMVRLAHSDAASLLRGGGAGSSQGRAQVRMKGALVGVQVALVVTLGCGALIFARAFSYTENFQTEFDSRQVLAAAPSLRAKHLERAGGIANAASELLRELEGATSGPAPAVLSLVPNQVNYDGNQLREPWITIEGRDPILERWSAMTARYGVTPSLLRVLGVPILSGRNFEPGDMILGANVAIINEATAHEYWPTTDPVSKRFKIGPAGSPNPWITVVGVAKGTTLPTATSLAMSNPGVEWKVIYLPISDSAVFRPTIVARLDAIRAGYSGRVRTAVAEVFGPDIPTRFATLHQEHAEQPRFAAIRVKAKLLVGFSFAAMLLGLIGIQALVAEAVLQRTREIGIRMALGAPSLDVLRSVLRDTVFVASAGLAGGCAIVAYTVFFASRLLLGIRSDAWAPEEIVGGSITDPRSYVLVLGLVIVAVATAGLIPARRALRVDPVRSLRAE